METRRLIYKTRTASGRRAPSEPARRSTPWKNGLSTWVRRPAQLRELRGRHAASPFYPAVRVSRRSQARLSERALRHMSVEPDVHTRSAYGAVGDMLRQRTMRAARRTRQTGKHVAGEKAGQVTDLHPTAQACAVGTPDLAGSLPLIPETCFPAPSSGSPSSLSPTAQSEGDTTTESASMTCDQTNPLPNSTRSP